MAIVLNPTDGLRNISVFPTNPGTEADARNQIQSVIDQVADKAVSIDEFESSIGETGWVESPSGLLEQWGKISIPRTPQVVNLNFPKPFPTALYGFYLTFYSDGQIAYNYITANASQSGMTLSQDFYSAPVTAYWRAIGK